MSLFGESMRPPALASDEAVRRYVELVRAEIEPDPLFRRRLRGILVNQFVAAREGTAPLARAAPSRAMGRLGRACLYASVAMAMTVGVTMAASQSALPGDPLYGVKLRIEALRVIALPAEFRDDLAIYALTERINELNHLAEAGRVDEVEALAGAIQEQVAVVVALGIAPETENGLLASRLEVLDAIVDRLPPEAQQAIERAMAAAPGLMTPGPGPATGGGQGTTSGRGQGDQGPPAEGPSATPEPAGAGVEEPPGQASQPPSASPDLTPPPEPDPTATPKPKGGGGQDADSAGDQ